jgi:two-component system sensor histidine kinase AgrC
MELLPHIIAGTFIYFIPLCCFLPFKMKATEKGMLFLILFVNIVLMAYAWGNIGAIILLVTTAFYISIIRPKRLKNICVLIATYMFCALFDNFYSLLPYIFFSVSVYSMEKDSFPYLFFMLTYILSLSFTCVLLAKLLKHLAGKMNVAYSIRLFPAILVNLLFCLFIFLFNIIAGEDVGYTPEIVTFNCILFTCHFIINSIATIRYVKSRVSEQEMKIRQDAFDALQHYAEQLESTYDTLRSFKHDYHNIMLSMSHYIESENMNGLKTFYNETIAPIDKQISTDTAHLNQLKKLGIPELKSLLSSKLLCAANQGIDVAIDIRDEVSALLMDTIDLVRVMGILLDNAIEAALECDAPAIHFSVISLERQCLFIIKNTFVDKGIPLSSIRRPDVSSKGKNRGVGLYNVEQILEKQRDVLWETETSDGLFIQRLQLRLRA